MTQLLHACNDIQPKVTQAHIHRWSARRAGYLPSPVQRGAGRKNGTVALWDPHCVARIRVITRVKRQGRAARLDIGTDLVYAGFKVAPDLLRDVLTRMVDQWDVALNPPRMGPPFNNTETKAKHVADKMGCDLDRADPYVLPTFTKLYMGLTDPQSNASDPITRVAFYLAPATLRRVLAVRDGVPFIPDDALHMAWDEAATTATTILAIAPFLAGLQKHLLHTLRLSSDQSVTPWWSYFTTPNAPYGTALTPLLTVLLLVAAVCDRDTLIPTIEHDLMTLTGFDIKAASASMGARAL